MTPDYGSIQHGLRLPGGADSVMALGFQRREVLPSGAGPEKAAMEETVDFFMQEGRGVPWICPNVHGTRECAKGGDKTPPPCVSAQLFIVTYCAQGIALCLRCCRHTVCQDCTGVASFIFNNNLIRSRLLHPL